MQNLAWAFGYNLVAVGLAAAGRLSPLVASLAMIASSAAVVANARRLGGRRSDAVVVEAVARPARGRESGPDDEAGRRLGHRGADAPGGAAGRSSPVVLPGDAARPRPRRTRRSRCPTR
ncbi:MAG: hypothetical protein ACKPBU_10925 [Alphaproteobacteria bacterium]